MSDRAERKKDGYGEWRLMGEVQGYIMARRAMAAPTVFSVKEWDAMQSPAEYDRDRGAYDKAMLRR